MPGEEVCEKAVEEARLTSAAKKSILNVQGFLNNSLSTKGKMNMRKPLIIQTDFGTADGAVCAMYGVSYGVDPELRITDLTHDIPQYDIWEASYRKLNLTVKQLQKDDLIFPVPPNAL